MNPIVARVIVGLAAGAILIAVNEFNDSIQRNKRDKEIKDAMEMAKRSVAARAKPF